MQLIIMLTKEVEDAEEGRFLYNLVKDRLADRTDVTVHGTVTNQFGEEEPT